MRRAKPRRLCQPLQRAGGVVCRICGEVSLVSKRVVQNIAKRGFVHPAVIAAILRPAPAGAVLAQNDRQSPAGWHHRQRLVAVARSDEKLDRHRRTVWDIFGVGDAIIVGDALHALALEVLLTDPTGERAMAATVRLATATSAMIAGQAQDVALDRRPTATLDECTSMEANKTGALLAQATAIGAVLGGGDAAAVRALESYGHSLGIAFQAIDDVLGIWGDSAETGKPVGNDLRERKATEQAHQE